MTLTTPPTPPGSDKSSTDGWVSPELLVVPETPEARACRRAATLRNWFVVFLIMGLIGAALVGYFGSERTTIDPNFLSTLETTTTHDATTGWTLFVAGVVTTLLTTLPLLGISFLLEGQADILCAWPDSETDRSTTADVPPGL